MNELEGPSDNGLSLAQLESEVSKLEEEISSLEEQVQSKKDLLQHLKDQIETARKKEAEAASSEVSQPQIKKRKRAPRKTDPNNRPKLKPHPTRKYVYECTEEGCTNEATGAGKCYSHGAKHVKRRYQYPICSKEGCEKRVFHGGKGGFCYKHGGAPPKQICKEQGCTNGVVNGGVCIRHGAKRKRRKEICEMEDCKNLVVKWGVCQKHGAKYRGKPCRRKRCKSLAENKHGLCEKHHEQKIKKQRKQEEDNANACNWHTDELLMKSIERATSKQGQALAQKVMKESDVKMSLDRAKSDWGREVAAKILADGKGKESKEKEEKDGTMTAANYNVCAPSFGMHPGPSLAAGTVMHNNNSKCCTLGCANIAMNQGLCPMHYIGILRRVCNVMRCSNSSVVQGLCMLHYAEVATAQANSCGLIGGYAKNNSNGSSSPKEEKGKSPSKKKSNSRICSYEGCSTLVAENNEVCKCHGKDARIV